MPKRLTTGYHTILPSYLILLALHLIAQLHGFSLSAGQPKDSQSLPASIWIEPNIGMKFVLIPAGSFRMGTPLTEPERESNETPHKVRLTRAFYLGAYEVTQGQWEKVMGNNPSHFNNCGSDCPVERVNYYDVQHFIEKLQKLSGNFRFRLPTEAEWEYACRAGTKTPFNTGNKLTTNQANYNGRFPYNRNPKGQNREKTLPVGSFPPNAWGLYDMHGNVWEWCQDWFCPYPKRAVFDPVGNCQTELKVIRGGSWAFNAQSARSGLRYTHRPQDLGYSLGFRLVREIEK
ncbi:MAG: formylglycine-generating enzyme family protein [Blastocatellales bacterium]